MRRALAVLSWRQEWALGAAPLSAFHTLKRHHNKLVEHVERTAERQEQTEADLRFVTLMNRALLELLMSQGTTTEEELSQLMQTLDREADDDYDGVRPSKLAESLGFPKPGLTNAQRLKLAEKASKAWEKNISPRRRSINRPQF